jgi:hypothetical protein
MKIMDKDGRLFGKISIIDVLVILVVIVLAVALNLKSELAPTNTTVANTPIYFEVLTEAIPNYVADNIEVGDILFDKDQSTGGAIGKITAVERLPGTRSVNMTDGTMTLVDVEDFCIMRLEIESSGQIDRGKFNINRIYNLGVNASRNFYSKYAIFKIFVTEIGTTPLA